MTRIAIVLGMLVLGGCAAETMPEETGEVGAASEELQGRGGGGLGLASCPGGSSPACVVCNGGCKTACTGDYTCDTAPGVCSYSPGQCRTSSLTPGFGGGIRIY